MYHSVFFWLQQNLIVHQFFRHLQLVLLLFFKFLLFFITFFYCLLIGSNLIKEVRSQINNIKIKLGQLLVVLFRFSKFLNSEAVRNMYNSRIYSVIYYCIDVWNGVSQCTYRCSSLKKNHKRIVKSLFTIFFPK